MKRFALSFCMVLALAGIAHAQPPKQPPEPIRSTRDLSKLLELEIDVRDFRDEIKLGDLTYAINVRLKEMGKPEIRFHLDQRAFREFNDVQPGELVVKMDRLPDKLSVRRLLQRAVATIDLPTEFLVRGGQIDLLPQEYVSKAHLLNRRVDAEYEDRSLQQVLDDLADHAGLTVVLDPRVKEKAKTTITARFRGDVAVQDAIRMVSEMADLKLVHLVSGLYVTTPDHATKLQKELRDVYEPQSNVNAPVMGLATGPNESPLAPPLPPPTAAQRAGGM